MISNETLAQAAEKAAAILNEILPEPSDCCHLFSARFERRMKRLLRRSYHPVLYCTLQYAASILLVIMIGFGSILAVNVNAREAVLGWTKRQEENFYKFFFVGDADNSESHSYSLGWIPDGCVYVTTLETGGGKTYVYTDAKEALIQFTYISEPGNGVLSVDGVNYNKEVVKINGCYGEVYLSPNEAETNAIIWTDDAENILFYISGNFEKETLVKMAESVLKKS